MPNAHLNDLCVHGTCFHCFGTVGYPCAAKCEQCEEGKVYVLHWKSFEDVSVVVNHTEREDMVLKMTIRFTCAAALSRTHRSWCWLHGALWLHLRFLYSCTFSRQALPHSHHNFLPFWRCDNETASTASALRMTKLHKCAQFICKQDILIVFL